MLNQRLVFLFKKQMEQTASREEENELRQLMANSENEEQLKELLNEGWNNFEQHGRSLSADEKRSILDNIFRNETRVVPVNILSSYHTPWIRVAAALLIILAGLVAIYILTPARGKLPPVAGNINEVSTQPRSKTTLLLADGTQVWLHADSKLLYNNESFGKEKREVTLIGQAYFDVVKNSAVPFIIHTGQVNITVKGTAFNVKAYPNDKTIETTLVRGLIEITTEHDPERKILLKPNEKIVIPVQNIPLIKNEEDRTGSLYSITRLRPSKEAPAEISWIQNQLVFDNETFGSIAPKMASWYNVELRFMDNEVKQKRFSGTIEQETLVEILEAMQLSFAFSYEISNNVVYIGSK